MKTLNAILLLVVMFFGATPVFSQQAMERPSEGKALVYIINSANERYNIFDGEKDITLVKSSKYVVQEFEPGQHLFWSANPNNFIEADLSANKVYVFTLSSDKAAAWAGGQFGGFAGRMAGSALAGATLKVLDPANYDDRKEFYKAVKSMKKADVAAVSEKDPASIQKAMEKYNSLKNNPKESEKKILKLSSDKAFENADKPSK